VADSFHGTFKMIHTYTKLIDPSKTSAVELYLPSKLKCPLEEQTKMYVGAIKFSELKEWIESNAFGLVGIRKKETIHMFQPPMLYLYVPIDAIKFPSNLKYYRNRLVKIAKSSKSNIKFAISDLANYKMEVEEFGLTNKISGDTLVVIVDENDKVFAMEGPFSVPKVTNFLEDYSAGKLQPYMKSEPIPDGKDGHVTKVVALNFEEIVMDKTKDVLIEFYAPWCGHCKQLKPEYEKLAENMAADSDSVVIAAIDATANKIPSQFKVTGFPTIFWVPKNDKDSPKIYDGPRTSDGMTAWVAKEATQELQSYSRSGARKTVEL